MEIDDSLGPELALHLTHAPRSAPGRVGQRLLQSPGRRLDIVGVPRDPRGIVLACGSAAAAALGVAVLVASGDPIGFGYLAIAVVTYLFVQTRLVPTFFWLLVAGFGAWSALSGAPVGWVEGALAALLAGVAVLPATPRNVRGGTEAALSNIPVSNGSDSSPNGQPAVVEADRVDPPQETSTAQGARSQRPVRVQALGEFRFEVSGRDIAPQLEDKHVLAFFFKYLLARYANGDPRAGRTAAGDELSPGYEDSAKRERLRKQIYDLQHDVAPELGSIVRSNRSHVWLDLSEVDSDLRQLRDLCERTRREPTLVSSHLAGEIRSLLDQSEGQEFLVGFEDLEQRVNQGRGAAGQIVSNARLAIAGQRAELIRALAEYDDAIGRPEAAIPYLQSALDASSDRQDLARLLVTAYLKTGQNSRASEVRRQFDLSKE